jgi:hypothetical protein
MSNKKQHDSNILPKPKNTEKRINSALVVDYDPTHNSKYDFTAYKEKLEGIERRLHNIESLLWDNRDTYTSSLDIVANREIEISKALEETKKLLTENREFYTEAFDRLFAKEELLESILRETKEVLTENRKIYLKNSESLETIKENTPIFLGPRTVLNPYLNKTGLAVISSSPPTS